MIKIDKDKMLNLGISRFSSFVERYCYDTDWTLIALSCGVSDILNEPEHEGLIRAQYFGNDGYPHAVFVFLSDVFSYDYQTGLLFISEITLNSKLNDEQESELNTILGFFSDEKIDITKLVQTALIDKNDKFIDLVKYPDDFYKTLIEEINFQYIHKCAMSLSILVRKLIENLIIDILRKKYGTIHLDFYYNPDRRRFHDYSVLLKNLDERQNDFHYITQNLDVTFIRELNYYRETGNSSAHSIDTNINIEIFNSKKDDINNKVKLLIRILNNI